MNIDAFSLLIFTGLFNGLLALLFLSFNNRSSKQTGAYWLYFLVIAVLVILTEQFFRQTGLISRAPFLLFVSTPVFFCFLPIIFCFQQFLNGKKYIWYYHFVLPALILLLMLRTYTMPAEAKLNMFFEEDNQDPLWIVLLFLVFWAGYMVKIFGNHRTYIAALKNERSDDRVGQTVFFNKVIAVIGCFTLIFPISISIQYFPLSKVHYDLFQQSLHLVFSFIPHLTLIIFLDKKQVELLLDPVRQPPSPSQLSNDLRAKKQLVVKKINIEKWYLDPDLSLTSLAERLECSRTELSMIINKGVNKNFYDFINDMRVEEVIRHLRQGQHKIYSLDHIVKKSGFKSYTSFYRVFRKSKGRSPTQFLKDMEE